MKLTNLRLWFGIALGGVALLMAYPARAGATCLAESEDGKVVELELNSLGTAGSFRDAVLTIKDKAGAVLYRNTFTEPGQFAATLHEGKAVVIFTTITGEADIYLTFIGKDQDEYDGEQLLALLRDPKRKKDTGNRLIVSIFEGKYQGDIRVEDMVVTLHKDV